MADDKPQGAVIQSDEAREKVLANSSAGQVSAVGAARDAEAAEERIANLESRGSTVPIAGEGELRADYPSHEPAQPVGGQAQPANYSTNGTLPLNMVATPMGLQPVSAFTGSPAEAQKRVEEHQKVVEREVLRSGAVKLSKEKIESMSGADLRAVASGRGYDLGAQGGNRTTRRRFLTEQAKDQVTPDESQPTSSTQETESTTE